MRRRRPRNGREHARQSLDRGGLGVFWRQWRFCFIYSHHVISRRTISQHGLKKCTLRYRLWRSPVFIQVYSVQVAILEGCGRETMRSEGRRAWFSRLILILIRVTLYLSFDCSRSCREIWDLRCRALDRARSPFGEGPGPLHGFGAWSIGHSRVIGVLKCVLPKGALLAMPRMYSPANSGARVTRAEGFEEDCNLHSHGPSCP